MNKKLNFISVIIALMMIFVSLSSCMDDDNVKKSNLEYHLTLIVNRSDKKLSEIQKEIIFNIKVNDEFSIPNDKSILIHGGTWSKFMFMEESGVSFFLKPKKNTQFLERKLNNVSVPEDFNKQSTVLLLDSFFSLIESMESKPKIICFPTDPSLITDTLILLKNKYELFFANSMSDFSNYLKIKKNEESITTEFIIIQGINPAQLISLGMGSNKSALPSNVPVEIQEAYNSHISLMEKVREVKQKLALMKSKPLNTVAKSEIKGLMKLLAELLSDDEELLEKIQADSGAKTVEGLVKVLATELKKERQDVRKLAEELKVAKELIKNLEGVVNDQKGIIIDQVNTIKDAQSKLAFLQAQLECTFTYRKDIFSKTKEHVDASNGKGISRITVVCKISENKYVREGNRNIYLQLLSPNGDVSFNRGSISQGGETLHFCAQTQIYVQKSGSEAKLVMENPDKVRLEEGIWKVKVYDENRKIGETQFEVK
jgi:hypothetical protein